MALESNPELKTAEGGAWSTSEMLQRGMSLTDLADRRRRFEIVYWRDRFGGFHYPKWQFDPATTVRPEAKEILGVLRTHDTMRVLSWFMRPVAPGRKSLLDLIRTGRGQRAVAIVRREEEEQSSIPPLSRKGAAELRRRLNDFKDPTRYVIASMWTGKHATFFDLAHDGYVLNEITDGCVFRRREHAEAVARTLDGGKKHRLLRNVVVAVKKTAGGFRLLERLRDPLDPKRTFLARLKPAGAAEPPRFVPIAPPRSREHFLDAAVFAAENHEVLHRLIARARSRQSAERQLIRECGFSEQQASAVLELRWWCFTRSTKREYESELRALIASGPKARKAQK